MGWSLYQVYLKQFDDNQTDKELYLHQVEYIIRHHTDSLYSPFHKIIFTTVRLMLKGKLGSKVDYQRVDA